MFIFILILSYFASAALVLGLFPPELEARPTLQTFGYEVTSQKRKKNPFLILRAVAVINKPIVAGTLRKRISKDLGMAGWDLSPEEFFLLKEVFILLILVTSYPFVQPDMVMFWLLIGVAVGYMIPEYMLKGRIKKIKNVIVKELPDAIDLLGLCVNAGLDFMLALKWVVEKSPPSAMVSELNILLQEINVGKTRRDALKDLAAKYELPDLATFSRTLVQADKMGTSVSEALNLLSEDMRIARFRRGEQLAMKAPLKLLIPLLFFIFPVVGILVAGPIFLEFIESSPLQNLGRGGM